MPFDSEDASQLREASSALDQIHYHCSTRRERLTLAILTGLFARSSSPIEAVKLYDWAQGLADTILKARAEP